MHEVQISLSTSQRSYTPIKGMHLMPFVLLFAQLMRQRMNFILQLKTSLVKKVPFLLL
jgi:hypothetical protein